MKLLVRLLCLLTLAALLAGCAQRFNITTTSGGVITTRGRPVHDAASGSFEFTDPRGERRSIPAGSVRWIEPASDTPKAGVFKPEIAR